MSGRLVGEVLDHAPADLRPAERLVLVALADVAHSRDRTARYRCSILAIADRCCLGVGTVRNALAELVRRGLVKPTLVVARGRHQEYQLAHLGPAHRGAILRLVSPHDDTSTPPNVSLHGDT